MLRKHSKMWDGTLGEIKVAQHRIVVVRGARPIALAPYRAGDKAREIKDKEISKMLKAGMIEST